MKTRIFKREQAFSLIEVLISVTIFSILTIGLLSFFLQASSYSQKNKDQTISTYLAQNIIALMQGESFSAIQKGLKDNGNQLMITPENCSVYTSISECNNAFQPEINGQVYGITANVSPADNTKLNDYLIELEVTVEWDDQKTALKEYLQNESIR